MQLAIEGDLRFISHHDTMRAFERIASRANLPLQYSQGFNPRPVFSFTCPRPVGVASQDDRLVLALNGSIEKADLLARLNHHSLEGMRFTSARLLEQAKTLHPQSVTYEMDLPEDSVGTVTQRVAELANQPVWTVQRKVKSKRGKRPAMDTRDVDIKPMLAKLEVSDGKLRFVCTVKDGNSARPGEVLEISGLIGPEYLAELVRTKIEDEF